MEDIAATSIIVDNWSLQEIGGCLVNGLADGSVDEILIDVEHDSHSFKGVPRAGVQIEALLDLLVDIVLSQTIYVDSAFTNTWADSADAFAPIVTTGLLQSFRFKDHEEQLEEPRKIIVSDLCITSSIKQAQIENEDRWRLERKPKNSYMSALVWGTAGYLSRSHIFQAPYHGYPLRNRLVDQALFSPLQRDVITDTKNWLSSERLRIFQSRTRRGVSNQLTVVLPPIAVEIINEASDLSQLIPVAIQLRDKYQNLRIWLSEIQTGINADSAKDAATFKKTLTAISRDLGATLGKDDQFKYSLDITWPPALSIEIPILSGVRRKFGISAMLNRLLFINSGSQALRRLINMFGKQRNGLDLIVAKYLHEQTALPKSVA